MNIIQNLKTTNELLLFIINKHNISLSTLLNDDGACIQDVIDNNNFLIDSGGWISVDDELPYHHTVFSSDWYEDWHTNKYCPLQIITKDNMLRTAVFLEMKIQDFHGEKLFWLCNIESLSGKFVIHEISDDFLEIDEVKCWQPLPQPPKE